MEKIYTYFRWLSLDIVMGAIFFLSYLGSFYQANFSFSIYFALGSAIWLIYTADHLIDARSVSAPSGKRHLFHKQHARVITFVAGIILILGLINITFLPESIIKGGALLAAVCVGYLLVVYLFRSLWVKEILVAVAYSAGIFLAPLTLKGDILIMDVVLLLQVALIAFINLMIFSYFDMEKDRQDGFGSLVLRMGRIMSLRLIHIFCWVSLVVAVISYLITGSTIQGLFFLMVVVLYAIFLVPKLSIYDRFRVIGDGVFFLPLLFL